MLGPTTFNPKQENASSASQNLDARAILNPAPHSRTGMPAEKHPNLKEQLSADSMFKTLIYYL